MGECFINLRDDVQGGQTSSQWAKRILRSVVLTEPSVLMSPVRFGPVGGIENF